MEFFMPQMTGIYRMQEGVAGNEVTYTPIPNSVIIFTNIATGKEALRTETSGTGAFNFTIPAGRYLVNSYVKGGSFLVTIGGQSGWEVLANSPKTAFQDFIDNPDAGDVDGALLDQFKQLAAQSTQGAIDSQKSADQSLANSKVAIDRMDAAGVLMASIDDPGVTDFKSFPDVTQHYTIGRAMTNGPKGAASTVYTGMAYVFKRKYGAGLEKVIMYEDNTGSYRLERKNGVWGEWSNQADTQMVDNGLWDIPKTVPLGYLFDAPRNGKYYVLQNDPNFLPLTPEGRTASFVNVENYHNADKKYIKLTWSQATGSQRTYEIRKVNGTWQTATFNVRSSDISDLINGTAKDKVASEFAVGLLQSHIFDSLAASGSSDLSVIKRVRLSTQTEIGSKSDSGGSYSALILNNEGVSPNVRGRKWWFETHDNGDLFLKARKDDYVGGDQTTYKFDNAGKMTVDNLEVIGATEFSGTARVSRTGSADAIFQVHNRSDGAEATFYAAGNGNRGFGNRRGSTTNWTYQLLQSKSGTIAHLSDVNSSTSDMRAKKDIRRLSDDELEAISKVNFYAFRYKEEQAYTNENAIFVGALAQQVVKAFKDVGLDAFDYNAVVRDWRNDKLSGDDLSNHLKVSYVSLLILEAEANRYKLRSVEERLERLESILINSATQ